MERVVVLSGAGLSAASGIPTFRGAGGLWEGHDAMSLATPEAWAADPALVRRFYDTRRRHVATCAPNAAHEALVRWQRAWGPERVTLVTQNVDGLLERAGADALAIHGTLARLRCTDAVDHPTVPVQGDQDPGEVCGVCGAPLRPAVVWFGEVPHHLDRVAAACEAADLFVSVGTSGVVYPAAGFGAVAKAAGARTWEVNPEPSGAPWVDVVVDEGAETALPRLVEAVLTSA